MNSLIKYPWAKCNSITLIPTWTANSAEDTNFWTISSISIISMLIGIPQLSSYGIALGAIISHPPWLGSIYVPPSQGLSCEAFLPAWANCIDGTEPFWVIKSILDFKIFACSEFHSPESQGVILPLGSTALASTITNPDPPIALVPKWTLCQSVMDPSKSSHEYWHIGDTKTLFLIVSPLIVIGENK